MFSVLARDVFRHSLGLDAVDFTLPQALAAEVRLRQQLNRLQGCFVSEASVYRLLKAHDLITSPAFVVIKAVDAFKDKTTAPNQLWQTDFSAP